MSTTTHDRGTPTRSAPRRILLAAALALAAALSLSFAVAPAANAAARYTICAKTGDMFGAGTDSDVEVALHGDSGSTSWLVLDDSRNNFERNTMDCFDVWTNDIGDFYAISVWTTGNRNWYLSYMTLNGAVFPYNGWVPAGVTALWI